MARTPPAQIWGIASTEYGVLIFDKGNNTIGGSLGGNTIAFNGAAGISIGAGGFVGNQGNLIESNSIYSNVGLGIDLGDNGPDFPQDVGDISGPNKRQNFPILTSVQAAGGRTEIRGVINNEINPAKLQLQFFSSAAADASGFGEGQRRS